MNITRNLICFGLFCDVCGVLYLIGLTMFNFETDADRQHLRYQDLYELMVRCADREYYIEYSNYYENEIDEMFLKNNVTCDSWDSLKYGWREGRALVKKYTTNNWDKIEILLNAFKNTSDQWFQFPPDAHPAAIAYIATSYSSNYKIIYYYIDRKIYRSKTRGCGLYVRDLYKDIDRDIPMSSWRFEDFMILRYLHESEPFYKIEPSFIVFYYISCALFMYMVGIISYVCKLNNFVFYLHYLKSNSQEK